PDLFRRDDRVGEPGELAGDHAARMRARPDLEHPVVEGAQRREAELAVLHAQEAPAREAEGRGWEAERSLDADRVHRAYALVDVPDGGMHLVEVDGAEIALAGLPAPDRIRPEQRHALVLEHPP